MADINQDKELDNLDLKQDLNQDSPQSLENTSADESSYENKGLDDFVLEATKTKAEQVQDENSDKDEVKQAEALPKLSEEEAAELSLKGLHTILSISSKMAGTEVEIMDEGKMIFAAMTTPLLMKYGDKIQKAMASPSNVDLDSWMPELLAATALTGVSVPIYMQVRAAKINTKEEAANDGDQPKQSA